MLPSFEDYSCFVVCGKTDMRCGIHSLAHKVQDDLGKDIYSTGPCASSVEAVATEH